MLVQQVLDVDKRKKLNLHMLAVFSKPVFSFKSFGSLCSSARHMLSLRGNHTSSLCMEGKIRFRNFSNFDSQKGIELM
jgi:hypothetical protein